MTGQLVGWALIEAAEADADEDGFGLNLGACEYAQGIGSCSIGGCWEEPHCQTSCPREGWPPVVLAPYPAFLLAATRYAYRLQRWSSWQRVREFTGR